jgi:hypothetical protein
MDRSIGGQCPGGLEDRCAVVQMDTSAGVQECW